MLLLEGHIVIMTILEYWRTAPFSCRICALFKRLHPRRSVGACHTALAQAQADFIRKRSTFFSYYSIFCLPEHVPIWRRYPPSFILMKVLCRFYRFTYKYTTTLYISTVVKGIMLDGGLPEPAEEVEYLLNLQQRRAQLSKKMCSRWKQLTH